MCRGSTFFFSLSFFSNERTIDRLSFFTFRFEKWGESFASSRWDEKEERKKRAGEIFVPSLGIKEGGKPCNAFRLSCIDFRGPRYKVGSLLLAESERWKWCLKSDFNLSFFNFFVLSFEGWKASSCEYISERRKMRQVEEIRGRDNEGKRKSVRLNRQALNFPFISEVLTTRDINNDSASLCRFRTMRQAVRKWTREKYDFICINLQFEPSSTIYLSLSLSRSSSRIYFSVCSNFCFHCLVLPHPSSPSYLQTFNLQ